jgi:hypothetical protein
VLALRGKCGGFVERAGASRKVLAAALNVLALRAKCWAASLRVLALRAKCGGFVEGAGASRKVLVAAREVPRGPGTGKLRTEGTDQFMARNPVWT